jgi:hypothetical protein
MLTTAEIERVCINISDFEFWKYFKQFGYVQAAAFISAIVTDGSRHPRTIKSTIYYIGKFCTIFRNSGIEFIDKKVILSSK